MKHITTLHVNNDTYHIIKRNEYFLAIHEKYLDDNMTLTQTLNGFQMFASHTLKDCIERATLASNMKKLMSQGMTDTDAIKVLFNVK